MNLNEIKTIPLPLSNKMHKGACIYCENEENLVTNLIIYPSGAFAHLTCACNN